MGGAKRGRTHLQGGINRCVVVVLPWGILTGPNWIQKGFVILKYRTVAQRLLALRGECAGFFSVNERRLSFLSQRK